MKVRVSKENPVTLYEIEEKKWFWILPYFD